MFEYYMTMYTRAAASVSLATHVRIIAGVLASMAIFVGISLLVLL